MSPLIYFKDIAAAASQPGNAKRPTSLIAAIAADPSPLQQLDTFTQSASFMSALKKDFPSLSVWATNAAVIQTSAAIDLEQMLRWSFDEARVWTPSGDPARNVLTALTVIWVSTPYQDRYWDHAPADIGTNTQLLDELQSRLEQFASRTDVGMTGFTAYAEELREKLDAEANVGDWETVASLLAHAHALAEQSPLAREAARALAIHATERLTDALAGVTSATTALSITYPLSTLELLRLATATSNNIVQFLSFQQAITEFGKRELSAEEEQQAKALLCVVAQDEDKWSHWMRTIAQYPVRFPTLENALGRALAEIPDAQVLMYVEAVRLYPFQMGGAAGRESVGRCLLRFAETASEKRRSFLWTAAYDRWCAWNFDGSNPDTHIFHVVTSELDYAVTGYARECMSEAERTAKSDLILEKMKALGSDWYKSKSDYVSTAHRLLSSLQPFAQANAIDAGNIRWLADKIWDFSSDGFEDYWKLKYQPR